MNCLKIINVSETRIHQDKLTVQEKYRVVHINSLHISFTLVLNLMTAVHAETCRLNNNRIKMVVF